MEVHKYTENKSATDHIEVSQHLRAAVAGTEHVNVHSVALADALAKDQPSSWSWSMLQLYLIVMVVTLNDCMNGYDGSLMGSLNAVPEYHSHFNIGLEGSGTGIVFAIYTVGNIAGSIVAGPASDRLGRRFGMSLGCIFIIVGAIIEATAPNIHAFMGGRFLIGFGVPISTTAAPIYLVEIVPPSWRGLLGGLYNVVGYYVGAVVANWITYGTARGLTNDWAWRTPVIVQAFPSIVVLVSVWFLPESPRWLIAHGKSEQGREILIKFHGNGDPNSALVQMELEEIEQAANQAADSSYSSWWDYRCLFNSRPVLYRVWILMLISVFSQFIGGSVISYYLPVILENVGITSSREQLLLNGLNTIFSFLGGIAGSMFVDRLGRRTLLISGTFLTMLCYIPMNVIAADAANHGGHVSTGAGYAFIAFIFLYGITFSFGWTPLQALYPAEILTNDIRAKGVAFQSLMGGLASFINTYATPIALQNIGWKTYTIFLVLHFLELVAIYFTVVETKGRSLEELDEIFEDPHPVKKSLERRSVTLVAGEGVKEELD